MIGRRDESNALDALMAAQMTKPSALSFVVGPPGVGKSTMIDAWSSKHEATRIDARYCVDAEDVLQQLAEHLDLGEDATIEAALAQMPHHVLIFDQADLVIEELCALFEFWQTQQLPVHLVVVASSKPNTIAAPRFDVHGLNKSDAMSLLMHWGVDQKNSPNHILHRLIDLLDGHPSALIWIAQRHQVISPKQVLEHISTPEVQFSAQSIWGKRGPLGHLLEQGWRALGEEAKQLCLGMLLFQEAHPWTWFEHCFCKHTHQWPHDTLMTALQEAIDTCFVQVEEHDQQRHFRLTPLPARFIRDTYHNPTHDHDSPLRQVMMDALDQYTSDTPAPNRALTHLNGWFSELYAAWRLLRHHPEGDYPNLRRWIANQMAQQGSQSTWLGEQLGTRQIQSWAQLKQTIDEHLTRGHLLSAQRDIEQGLEVFGQDHTIAMQLYGVLARTHREATRFKEAARAFERVAYHASMLGDHMRAFRNIWRQVQMLINAKEHELAHTQLTHLLSQYHDHPQLHDLLPRAMVLMEAAQAALTIDTNAAQRYLDALFIDLSQTANPVVTQRLWMLQGDVFAINQQWEQALTAYQKAESLTDGPPLTTLSLKLMTTHAWVEQWSIALKCAEHITEHHLEVLWQRGALAYVTAHYQEALDDWMAAMPLVPREDQEARWMTNTLVALAKHHLNQATQNEHPDTIFERLQRNQWIHHPTYASVITLALATFDDAELPDLPTWRRPGEQPLLWMAYMLKRAVLRQRQVLAPGPQDAQRAQREHAMLVYSNQSRDVMACMMPSGLWIELHHKPLLQRAIGAMLEHHANTPEAVFEVQALFDAVWPDEPHTAANSALNRVRVMISRLRVMGFKPWIITASGGYVFAKDIKRIDVDVH